MNKQTTLRTTVGTAISSYYGICVIPGGWSHNPCAVSLVFFIGNILLYRRRCKQWYTYRE